MRAPTLQLVSQVALVALVVCLGAATGCGKQKALRIETLETQKRMILERTQPKQAFWDQVGRKGQAVKKEHAAAAELASVRAQIAQIEPSLAQARKQLEAARATNAKTADVLTAQLAQLDEAQHAVTQHEAELSGFQTRQRSGKTP